MEKFETYLRFSFILFWCIAAGNQILPAQTKKTTPPDTSQKVNQKIRPKEDLPKLELPDVIIYGTNRAVRVSGDKLNRPTEDFKLVAPTVDYKPVTTGLQFQNHKGYFQSQQRHIHSRTVIQLDGGRYQQINFEASRWKEAEKYNYSFQGKYERSNGHFENSQYDQALIKGQVGFRLSPNFIISTRGNFQLFDYGLYGAQIENLTRETRGGKLKIDAQWSLSAIQSTNFSVYFDQKNCTDRDAANYQSKLMNRNIGILSSYQTQYRSIPFFVRGIYEYQTLDHVTIDSISSQTYFQVKGWASFKIKQFLIIKPGLLFENLDLNDSYNAYQISPDMEMIVTPTKKFGIVLSGTKNYIPIHYADRCEHNPFISHDASFIPIKKELELKIGVEYHLSSKLSVNGEVTRQNWKNYAPWSRQPETGLFQFAPLKKVTINAINFLCTFTPSPRIKLDAGFQMNFDTSENGSLEKFDNHLPYLERLRIPFHFEYQINKTTNALLTFLWIGPRYFDLNNDEKLSKFGLLSLYFEKQFHKNISGFIEGNNLLNQDYEFWQGYPAMGIYFEAGLKANW